MTNQNIPRGITPTIKCWMDTMHLKLYSDKTEYILFGSQA